MVWEVARGLAPLVWFWYRQLLLGWEFQFSVPISGTPIGSGILIPFLIPEIPVRFFFWFPLLKNKQIWIPIPKFEIQKKIRRKSVHLILYQKTIAISFPTKITSCCHLNIYSKQVAAISTSTENGCRHTYIYSKRLPPYLHLLKTVAPIPTSTQNSCR